MPFPFRVKELPEGFMQDWKRRALDAFGLQGFSIRAGWRADWRDQETAAPPKGMLTLLGDRAVAIDCLRELLVELGDSFYGEDAENQFDVMFEEEFVPETPGDNEEVVVERRHGFPMPILIIIVLCMLLFRVACPPSRVACPPSS